MNKLRERHLLCKAFMYVIIPVVVMALFGSFYPYM